MRVKFLMVLLLFLFLEGCSQASTITITDQNHQEIEDYLRHQVMNPSFGGENFTAYEVLGSNPETGEIYIWAFIQEYYRKGSDIEEGTGMSVPMVLKLDQSGNSFKVGSHTLPRDGSFYADDLKDLFPKLAERKALDYPSRHINKLIEEAEEKANKKLN